MSFFAERKDFRLPAGLLPLSLLLVSCASPSTVTLSSPAPEKNIVVGSGTSDERDVIEKTDEQMQQQERGTASESAAPVVNQGLP
jgi:hypothetical protein